MLPIKNLKKCFGEQNYQTLLKSEKVQGLEVLTKKIYIIRIFTGCSLKTCQQFFLTQLCVFHRKERYIFTYFNVKLHPLPFKSAIFF